MRIEEANDDNDIIINLKNIHMPFLNIVAKRDDLVAPRSSKALNNALTESHDKDLIEFNSGHVGLMIGSQRTLAQSRGLVKKAVVVVSW